MIITDKMVRFHARDTRLATLHNSAMYGPSHPAEAHICTVYGDDETPHSYLSVCLSVSYLCLSVFNAVSEKERQNGARFSPPSLLAPLALLTMASCSSSSAGTTGSCVHKRVSANNAGAASSCLHKRVSSRELSGTTKFKKMSAYQRFSNFQLAVEHDTHDPVRGLPQLNKLSM